jgi:hypothetical protein
MAYANHLETPAMACADDGDFDSAVKWQTKANELCSDHKQKTCGESQLKLYGERRPLRDTDVP